MSIYNYKLKKKSLHHTYVYTHETFIYRVLCNWHSLSVFNEPQRGATSKERDGRRNLHSTGCLQRGISFEKIRQHKQESISSPSTLPARARLYTIVMYKVLRVNGQQTGREPRINERNFGTCGMPRFIPYTYVHASSAAVFTRVPFLLWEEKKKRIKKERQAAETGTGQTRRARYVVRLVN